MRNLKVLDLLFNRPMQQERGVKVMAELALALFPNMEEMIALHGQRWGEGKINGVWVVGNKWTGDGKIKSSLKTSESLGKILDLSPM